MSKGLLQALTWRSATLVLFETSLIIAGIGTASYVRLGADAWGLVRTDNALLKTALIAYVLQLCFYYNDLYDDPRVSRDRPEFLIRIFQALGTTSLVLAALYFWFPSLILGRGVFALSAIIVAGAVIGWRVVFNWLSVRVGPRERLLMVGTSAAGVDLARELHQREDLGVEIVGFIDADPSRVGMPLFNPSVIGTLDDIPQIVRARSIDKVVVSLADARGRLPMDKLLDMRLQGVSFEHLATVYEHYTGKIAVDNLRPSWLIFSAGFRQSRWRDAAKRGVDLLAASLGLLLALPVLAVLAAVIKLTSRGVVVYTQQRVGLLGREFTVYKLRSMCADAEAQTGAVWARPDGRDVRVTPIGRLMRRTRLDELPQLWNILRGDMSLVGPRPERPEFVRSLIEQIPFYGMRHSVKPGLTGWAQVRYTYGASVEDAMQKLQFDLYYIKNLAISLDLFIIFETIKTVVLRRGA